MFLEPGQINVYRSCSALREQLHLIKFSVVAELENMKTVLSDVLPKPIYWKRHLSLSISDTLLKVLFTEIHTEVTSSAANRSVGDERQHA